MDTMFDALFLLSKHDSENKLRVPLSALIDYKGFRCIAIGLIPILPSLGPFLGFNNGEYIPTDADLKSIFTNVGETLNLQEHQVVVNSEPQTVPVSQFAKIYNFSQTQEDKLKNNQNYASKQSNKFHFNELDYMEKPFYVLKTSEIFPYDAEQLDSKNVHQKQIKETLRPEFLCNYDTPLTADTLRDFQHLLQRSKEGQKGPGIPQDIQDLSDASKFLKNQVLHRLVCMMDDLQIMPVDSESLTETLHSHGVNIRYLSHIAVKSTVPHVKELCITEMLARTCKNILNHQVSQMVLANK